MKKDIKLFDIVLMLIAIILILINIVAYINIVLMPNVDNQQAGIENENKNNEKDENQETLERLQTMAERDRMEFYFSEYATYIEDGEYEKAYNLLYPDFKTNYFPTLEKFEEYAKKIYPEFMTFSYNNIERQGYIYILNIDIIDVENKNNKKSHRVVIQENDFNDFVLSFQVI